MIFKVNFDEKSLPLSEYPRPQFKRDSYLCLNGEWDYVVNKNPQKPTEYKGKITVPYSPETKPSKVEEQVMADDFLHYRKTFSIPTNFNRGRIFINFGACDQVTKVYINGNFSGEHLGGYNAFSFEITDYIINGENEIYVCVTDDASSDIFGRGKQTYNRGGIWYTATSGIWQTVWLESTPDRYIKGVKIYPDYDNKKVELICDVFGEGVVTAQITDDGNVLDTALSKGGRVILDASKCKAWSPENPELYNIELTFGNDRVTTYFGLRKFSTVEASGKKYFELNGKPYFHNGLLDQGYWHEGLYTPPSNKAMFEEVKRVKELGFNMLRKHIKVEPMLWYYYCDVLGVLVWQDMMNGGGKYSQFRIMLAPFINLHIDDKNYKKMKRSEASKAQYMFEAKEMMAQLFNCVSLCLWTPFNEAWGQFDAYDVWKELKKFDSTRPFDHASGWQDKGGGDVNSRHIYFRKARMKNDGKRVLALTEFGGYSYPLDGHVFTDKKFGYKTFKTEEQLTEAYKKLYYKEIIPAIKKVGLGATVYTQVTDVEDEINGLFTYDRVQKINADTLREINRDVYKAFDESINKAIDS